MHIRIERWKLLRELALLHSVVERKVTIPILSRVLLTAWPTGHVSLAATNGSESLLSDGIEAEVLIGGQAALPADLLLSIVKVCADGLIELKAEKDTHCALTSGSTHVRLPLMPVADFPTLPNPPATIATVPAGQLRDIMRQARYAAPTLTIGTYVPGIRVELGPEVRMVAMDGHRLGMSYRRLAAPPETPVAFTLPVRACGALEAMLSETHPTVEVSISSSENGACFRCDQRMFTARLLEVKFPAYGPIISRLKHSTVVDVNRDALLLALRRLATVATKEHAAVAIEARGGRLFLDIDTTTGHATDQVLADNIKGDDARMRVNLHYVIEFLSLMDATEVMVIGNCAEARVIELGPVEPGVTCIVATYNQPKAAEA